METNNNLLDKMCKVVYTEDGKQLIAMPDGSIIPYQFYSNVSQDLEQSQNGIGEVVLKLSLDLRKSK